MIRKMKGKSVRVKIDKDKDFQEVEIGLNEPIYTTGVVCRILGIPIWVLKQLDIEKIVSPPREGGGKSRLYSKKELKEVQRCWCCMKKYKIKLAGLKVILKMEKKVF